MYLNGRVDSMEPATIALNIIDDNLADAVDQILEHTDPAEAACVTLLVLDELIERTGDGQPECSEYLYRLLERRVGRDTHTPAKLTLVDDD